MVRRIGTNDQRAGVILNWERPGIGALGDVWSFTARLEAAAYSAFDLNQQPNYASIDNTTTARLQPTAALKVSWPLLRILPRGGSLIVEPIAQFILSPNTGSSTYSKVPNEDSLAPEFTDTELFSINRFQGLDRQEGGIRANLGMHLNLTTPALGSFDGLVGQSYRLHADDTFPAYVGLDKYVSDLVGRITYTPSSLLDLTARTRVDHQNFDVHYGELVGSIGPRLLRLSTGYIYSANTPYFFNERPPQGDALLPRNGGAGVRRIEFWPLADRRLRPPRPAERQDGRCRGGWRLRERVLHLRSEVRPPLHGDRRRQRRLDDPGADHAEDGRRVRGACALGDPWPCLAFGAKPRR